MLLQDLYEALDDLEAQAYSNAEIFAKDGDLSALATRLAQLGQRSYSLSAAVGDAAESFKSALK